MYNIYIYSAKHTFIDLKVRQVHVHYMYILYAIT